MSEMCRLQNVTVHGDDEKIVLKLVMDDEDDNAYTDSSSRQNNLQATTCRICYEKPCDVLFVMCRHMKICTTCYKQIYDQEKTRHLLLYPRYNDNDLFDNDDDTPPIIIKCPVCRKLHSKEQIIIEIFT